MPIHIVRLGTPRLPGEGVRLGTVRRPPRGVPKKDLAARDFYDLWLPELAPSEALLKLGRAAEDDRAWRKFAARYRKEMSGAPGSHVLDLIAALSRTTSLAVGCYCADEARCHRSILRELLLERKADVAP